MLEETKEIQTPSSRLSIAGLAFTFLYVISISYFSFVHLNAFDKLGPDDWADFLAGVFAPLAFLWLVLGFFQQGHELRQSAHALWLQSVELRNSVEQQRALVEATREQIDFDRDILQESRAEQERRRRPILRGRPAGGGSNGIEVNRYLQIENYGATCTNAVLEIRHNGNIVGGVSQAELPKGGTMSVQFNLPSDFDINGLSVICRFVDQDNIEGVKFFEIRNTAPEGNYFSFKVAPIELPN